MKLAPVVWENCKRPDGSYSLTLAARHTGCKVTEQMDLYLSFVEAIRPVTSRQIAALSIATAMALYPQSETARQDIGEKK